MAALRGLWRNGWISCRVDDWINELVFVCLPVSLIAASDPLTVPNSRLTTEVTELSSSKQTFNIHRLAFSELIVFSVIFKRLIFSSHPKFCVFYHLSIFQTSNRTGRTSWGRRRVVLIQRALRLLRADVGSQDNEMDKAGRLWRCRPRYHHPLVTVYNPPDTLRVHIYLCINYCKYLLCFCLVKEFMNFPVLMLPSVA